MKSDYTEEKILIWGKTYPELSKKYIETVCTAGVLESGKPVRLYPITYRYLNDGQSFEQKFEDLKKTVAAQRAQIQMFGDAIPPEMKKLEFLKSRVVVSWFCKGKDCTGHTMQVLDWGLCELQRRDGSEAALNRM